MFLLATAEREGGEQKEYKTIAEMADKTNDNQINN